MVQCSGLDAETVRYATGTLPLLFHGTCILAHTRCTEHTTHPTRPTPTWYRTAAVIWAALESPPTCCRNSRAFIALRQPREGWDTLVDPSHLDMEDRHVGYSMCSLFWRGVGGGARGGRGVATHGNGVRGTGQGTGHASFPYPPPHTHTQCAHAHKRASIHACSQLHPCIHMHKKHIHAHIHPHTRTCRPYTHIHRPIT